MIDMISEWAGELIVALVIVTLIEMLLPDNRIKKYVKTVIGIYIVFCIISPFINKEQFWTIIEDTEKQLEKIQIESQVSGNFGNSDTSIESLYIEEFEKDVIKKVEQLGYKVKKCNVDIKINATKDDAGINAIYLNIGNQKINNKESENVQISNVEKVEISINDQEKGNNNTTEKETEDSQKVKEFLSSYYEISEDKIKVMQD